MLKKYYRLMNEAGDGDASGGGAVLSSNEPASAPQSDSAGEPPHTASSSEITFPENWKDAISEEYRNEPALNVVPDIPTLVKNYIHAQKSIGKQGVPLPDKHSTDDDKRAFFQKLGLPESPDKYELSTPKEPSFEDGFLSQFKEAAYKANILPDQANKLLEWYNSANSQSIEQAIVQEKTRQQEELKALRQEWGSDYDTKTKLARAVLRTAGADESVFKWLEETGLDNSAMMIKLMSQIGDLMKEDGVIELGDNVGPSGKEIKQRLQELETNMEGPLYNKSHPNHHSAVKEREALYNQLYPSPN